MNHKWSLVRDGKERVYILTEYQLVGEEWIQLSETQWTKLDGALDHIRKGNDAWIRAKI